MIVFEELRSIEVSREDFLSVFGDEARAILDEIAIYPDKMIVSEWETS